jgi:hypothetical protein
VQDAPGTHALLVRLTEDELAQIIRDEREVEQELRGR